MAVEPEDTELIAAAARGDQDAFFALYERYKTPVWRFAVRMLADRELSADVVQDTFEYFFRKIGTYKPQVRTLTFLIKVARNRCLNIIEKRRRQPFLPEDLPEPASPAPGPEGEAGDRELAAAAAAAVALLEPKDREAIALRVVEGLSYAEMAKVMGVPEGTAKSRLHYALEAARKLVAQEEKARKWKLSGNR